MKLYKRNAGGKPIFWQIAKHDDTHLEVSYGIIGLKVRTDIIKGSDKEMLSLVNSKRKEGYKELSDLYDNAPEYLESDNLYNYLNTYLPKYNTHEDGKFIPMLCKTLNDNKPFERNHYMGSFKINGERCIVSAFKTTDMFNPIKLNYRSREGIDWTNKLSYLDEYLIPLIGKELLDMMVEENVSLDGELYLPGYGINQINSIIKNDALPQHYQLQYWVFDLAVENIIAVNRYNILDNNLNHTYANITSKEAHFNNKERLNLVCNEYVDNYEEAVNYRDKFISYGFEGIVIRDINAEYQFGGKRNNSMLKFKKVLDGLFEIKDIVPEGKQRSDLPKFICANDINDELFECTINKSHVEQREILANKDKYIGRKMLVEFRERSGIKSVPFHAKGITIK